LFKNKSKLKKILIIAISLALFLIPTVFVFADTGATTAQASTGTNVIDKTLLGAVTLIVGGLCYIAVTVITLGLWIIGTIFDWVIGGTTINASSMNEIVTAGWVLVRDILNIIFVLALLGIAFATILRIEAYQFKTLLPKLLVGALLVNFSKTIALTLVDFSNAIMSGIMGTQNGATASASLLALFNVSSFLDLSMNLGTQLKVASTEPAVLGTNILVVVFLGMFTMALAGLAVLLVIRTVVLMILVVFSPIAFVLNVLPVTQKYASKWWEEFTKYLFVGPVVCICYLLALLFAVKFSQGGGITGLTGNVATQFKTNVGMSSGTIGQFFGMAIACGIMFVGFTFSKEAAEGLAGSAMGLVKKGLMGTAALAGGFGARKLNESLMSGKKGNIGKLISKGLQLARVSPGTADKAGDLTKFLSPTLVAEGWKERQAKRTAEAMSGGAGFIHGRINAVTNKMPWLFGKDETDFERRGQMESVDKHMSEMKKYGKGSHEYYRKELRDSLVKKDMSRAEAAVMLLEGDVNFNEIMRDGVLGKMVGNKSYDKEGNVTGSTKTDSVTGAVTPIDNTHSTSYEAWQDFLIHNFGNQRAKYIAGNSNDLLKGKGEWDKAESVRINEQGQMFWNPDHAKDAAVEWSKVGSRSSAAVPRFAVSNERYQNGSAVELAISPVLQEYLKIGGVKGYSKGTLEQFMPDATKKVVQQLETQVRGVISATTVSAPAQAAGTDFLTIVRDQTGGEGFYPGTTRIVDKI
jgi:hypothetical protein